MTEGRVLVGLIGANIMKSISPALHADAFASAGIDGYYHLMDVNNLPGRSLADQFAAAKTVGFAGVNVTIPFKQDMLSLVDTLDGEAGDIGAVNTVIIAEMARLTATTLTGVDSAVVSKKALGERVAKLRPWCC